LAGLLAALALAPAATAGLPDEGLFVPGRSLGGVELGMTREQVRQAWGASYGRCRDCPAETWYFTYQPFEPEGAGVTFRRNRAVHVFTLWQPAGWRTDQGLRLGAVEADVTDRYGVLIRRQCIGYTALLRRAGEAMTAFYVFDGELWGFGLMGVNRDPCR
jgi:hypothetical protein